MSNEAEIIYGFLLLVVVIPAWVLIFLGLRTLRKTAKTMDEIQEKARRD